LEIVTYKLIISWNSLSLNKNITKNVYVEKTYSIRKVGGRGSGKTLKKIASVGLFHVPQPP